VHRGGHVHDGLLVTTNAGMTLARDDVGAGGVEVTGLHQHPLGEILDVFEWHQATARQPCLERLRQCRCFILCELPGRTPGCSQGLADLTKIERNPGAVASDYCFRHWLYPY